jgi:beta-glucosidase/6-phospho-beta-glucosidase/beta-galactosidase
LNNAKTREFSARDIAVRQSRYHAGMRSLAVVACALACGCSSPEDLRFPKTFLFGTAIAGFQVEMGCPTTPAAQCEDPNSDWYDWITKPALVGDPTLHISGQPPSVGPGFFELYPQDLDRAAGELHGNALRLSIEWSRLFPTPTDNLTGYDALKAAASPAALAYYHALFAALKAHGLTPLVTLDHYTLPSWIHDAEACHADITTCAHRGWVDRDRTITEIAKYAGFAAQEFGGEVDLWATLNEPFTAVVLAGFLFQTAMRTNPPGVFLQTDAAKTAYGAMVEAHARMYDAVKQYDTVDADGDGKPARVGIVYNLQAAAPATPGDPTDAQAVKNLSYLMNQAFLDGVGLGQFDAQLDGNAVHRDDLAHRLDFLGINYYARTTVQGTETPFLPQVSPLVTFDALALGYDYDYARGIYEVLKFAKRYQVPCIITETGREDPNDSGVAPKWIVQTLTWVRRAMREGVPVEGYFYWSLMDNYEWNHGMTVRMGLYAVDGADPTKARTARAGVGVYGRVAAGAQIPADLARTYPAN